MTPGFQTLASELWEDTSMLFQAPALETFVTVAPGASYRFVIKSRFLGPFPQSSSGVGPRNNILPKHPGKPVYPPSGLVTPGLLSAAS